MASPPLLNSESALAPTKSQRLDKWLWYARVTKTRSLAQKLIKQGGVRVDSQRITRPSTTITPNATLTIAYANRIRILKMLDPGTMRGPAPLAQTLYQDLSPPPPPKSEKANRLPTGRDPGAGRPTKKQRRETDHLLGR